jgi:DNA-directed RNA polymerase subunit RPC12/RpoP
MKATTFNCKNCGASVPAPKGPGIVTCAYCGSEHRVTLREGSMTAQLVAKVKQLDEDVARLKGAAPPSKKPPGLKERLAMIANGNRKWHEYVSLVNAGKGRWSDEAMGVYRAAQVDLLAGYGPEHGELINVYYNPKTMSNDPAGGYSCLFMAIGIIILLLLIGGVALWEAEIKRAVIFLTLGVGGLVAGIPLIIYSTNVEKKEIAERKEALHRLEAVEREMKRRVAAEK